MYSYKLHIFLGKDNANFVNFYQKAGKTNRAMQLYANYMIFDITRVNNLTFFSFFSSNSVVTIDDRLSAATRINATLE